MSAGNIIDITDDGSPYAGRGDSESPAFPPGNPLPPYTTERLDTETVGDVAYSRPMAALVFAGFVVLILGLSAGMVLARWIWS